MYRKSILPIALYLAAATAAADPSAGQGAAQTAPDSNVAEGEKKKRAPKNPENLLNIINGRMPMPLVYLIRFKREGVANAEVAKQFGTSVGKVFDIRKNANFAYITADYKPSADELEAAKKWCTELKTHKGQSLKDAGGDPDGIVKQLGELGVATPDEVSKRTWTTRTVGAKKPAANGQAPVAAAAPAASGGGSTAGNAGSGAKMF